MGPESRNQPMAFMTPFELYRSIWREITIVWAVFLIVQIGILKDIIGTRGSISSLCEIICFAYPALKLELNEAHKLILNVDIDKMRTIFGVHVLGTYFVTTTTLKLGIQKIKYYKNDNIKRIITCCFVSVSGFLLGNLTNNANDLFKDYVDLYGLFILKRTFISVLVSYGFCVAFLNACVGAVVRK